MNRRINLLVALLLASAPVLAADNPAEKVDTKSFLKSYTLTSPRTVGSLESSFAAAKLPASRSSESTWNEIGSKMESRSYDDAIELLSELINKGQDKALAYSVRAKCWFLTGKFDKAIADADKAVALDAKIALPWLVKGISQMKLGDGAGAIVSLSEVVKLDPNNAEARYYRGVCYFYGGEFAKTVADQSVVIQANPNDYDALWSRTQANASLGNWNDVKADGSAMIKINPSIPEGHFGLAYGLLQTGSGYESVAEYQQASACYRELNNPEAVAQVKKILVQLIPMFDYGKSRTPIQK
ncbi:MAG: tetratricopeptide repeat protein [Cyanobacteria bacterium]|nr:tetratricopeptide repeat protein [Cyanobacteriota bacterium]